MEGATSGKEEADESSFEVIIVRSREVVYRTTTALSCT